jgi:hypothetical protein
VLDSIFSSVCDIKKHDRVFQNKIEGNGVCMPLSFSQNLNEKKEDCPTMDKVH